MGHLVSRRRSSRLWQVSLLALPLWAAPFSLAVSGEPEAVFVGLDLSVASATVPPGGTLQMQVSVTEPNPILKGKQGVRFASVLAASTSPLGAVRDAALFSPSGDVSGVALLNSASPRVFFSSPLTSFGMAVDTPVIAIA